MVMHQRTNDGKKDMTRHHVIPASEPWHAAFPALLLPAEAKGRTQGVAAMEEDAVEAHAPIFGPSLAMKSPALQLAVQSSQLVVLGAPDENTAALPLLSGLPGDSLSSRQEEPGMVVLGLHSTAPKSMADFAMGKLHCRRFLALPKTSLYWMSPRWGSTVDQVPVETQFLLLEIDSPGSAAATQGDGSAAAGGDPCYALLLPLIDSGKFRASLRPPRGWAQRGSLVLRLESGSPAVTASTWPSALLAAAGWDPFELVERGVRAAARLSGVARPRVDKAVPPSVDAFGWCSWDAFYSMVSAAGLAEGLKALQAGGVPARVLIIDDGWQRSEVDEQYRALASKRHLVGQVSVPHSKSEVELEDAVVDLVMGPSDERETNMRHTVNVEEDEILSFTPRALTPRQAAAKAAANPFALSPGVRPSASYSLLSPRRTPMRSPLRPHASAAAVGGAAPPSLPGSPVVRGRDMMGSPIRPPTNLKPIDASRRPTSLDIGPSAAKPSMEAAATEAAAAEPVNAEPAAAEPAALEAAAGEEEEATEAAVTRRGSWWDRLHLSEAAALRLLKSWLDTARSDSWRFWAFSAAATSLLRPTLLRFYATATEHSRRLAGIEANAKFGTPVAGPDSGDLNTASEADDLRAVVSYLKQRYGLRYVYFWHALMGFWGGVMPDGAMAKYRAQIVYPRPSPGVLEIDPSYAWVQSTLAGVGLPDSPRQLHQDMHAYLKGCGADGVKVDVQGLVGHAGTATKHGSASLAAAYHASLEDSAAAHFGSSVINCMCGSTEDLYNMRDTNLGRVSDDFYPRNRASFTTHISTCAFCSLFCGEIHIPDWDMFHSRHSAALLHATARAVSGGPVYISDKPGQHDFALLKRLVLRDGSVPRCLLPGRPTADCLFLDVNRDEASALKVWNMNRCGGVVAAFNVQGASWSTPRRGFHFHNPNPPPVAAHVKPADVPGLVAAAWGDASGGVGGGSSGGGSGAAGGPSTKFAVWVDGRQELLVLGADEAVTLQLAPAGSEILTIVPITSAPAPAASSAQQAHQQAGAAGEPEQDAGSSRQAGTEQGGRLALNGGAQGAAGGVSFAPIGLVNLLNAGGAVVRCGWETAGPGDGASGRPAASGPRYRLTTVGAGTVLANSSRPPAAVEAFGGAVRFQYLPRSGALQFEVPHGLPLAVEWSVQF